MTSQESEQIRQWNEGLNREILLRFRTTEDERSKNFEAFCDQLSRSASKVRIVKGKGEGDEEKFPVLQISETWTYQAIPQERELVPFLEILSLVNEEQPEGSESLRNRVGEVRWPAHFKIYVTPQCPFCPQAVKQMAPLPFLNPNIQMTLIDGMLFPEVAREDRIQAVPTVILDDRFRWAGSIKLDDVLDVLVHRDPAQFGPATFKNMLKQGEAARLAEMMIQRNQIFPAFPELVTHPDWSVRLGAMVVMEEISAQHAALAAEALESLWQRFEGVQDSIKGDLIYLCGESGDTQWVPRLEAVLTGSYGEEVQEVTKEALEKLKE